MSALHAVTHERFDEENEDRFELAGNAGYATATDQGHQVFLLELWVDPGHRGQGRGTALLEAVIAHYEGRVLALSAEPFTTASHKPAGLSADQLAAWYTRRGFQRHSGHRMARLPGSDRADRAQQPAAGNTRALAAQTFEERAREALTRAGEIAAEAEASFRRAITGLNHAIDLAHAAGTMPQTVNRLVTARASLGDAARGYLALEIQEWERAYLPGTWNSASALSDLHERSLQPGSAPFSPDAAAEALTDAGIRLAQAEAVLDGALGRLDDALEFALRVGFGTDEMQGLVNPGGHLGPISSQFLKDAAVTDWDLDGYAYDGEEEGEEIPRKFRDLHLLALAAKGEGDHLAAAAIWETALTHLPNGHSWHPRIGQTITSLRAVTHPGDIVTWDGRLIRSKASVHPAASLTDLVHDHEAAAGALQQPAALEPVTTTGRYVVARINKTYGTLGEHPGPQHVGKTFVPYDDRYLSKEAAEESANVSNDRYRPSVHGRTFIAVRAEPIAGTNKFRNLDHPGLAGEERASAGATRVRRPARPPITRPRRSR
jgi:GNAT superfamily N-acetyltransferase